MAKLSALLINLIIIVTFLSCHVINSDDIDDLFSQLDNNDEEEDNQSHSKSKYYQPDEWFDYLDKIEKAKQNLDPCQVNELNCFSQQIDQDLNFWYAKGVTKELIELSKPHGVHYQIINRRLYRQADCMFPSRCQGIEHFLLAIKDKLPDIEIIINVRDWPQTIKGHERLPIMSFSRDNQVNLDILYPAWSFWSGGPAIDQYPTGIGRFDLIRKRITKSAVNWTDKINQAFFRGSRTSSDRDWLILLSRRRHDLIDAQYTKNQAWRSPSDTLGADPAPTISFEDHCNYKYLVNMRGVAASFRFKHLFLCKSLVFDVQSTWVEFFYHRLKPWYHYVPVNQNNFESIATFFKVNDDLAQTIANNGFEFIYNYLTLDAVQSYWEQLLIKYSKTLKYKPKRLESLKEILKKGN